MLVKCVCCGPYEIGARVYDELVALPESHSQIDRLREELERISRPVKIVRNTNTNIVEVESLEEKLTKMQKRLLRKKAEEGKPKIAGHIYYKGKRDK